MVIKPLKAFTPGSTKYMLQTAHLWDDKLKSSATWKILADNAEAVQQQFHASWHCAGRTLDCSACWLDLAWVMVRAVDKADVVLTLSSALWYREPFTTLFLTGEVTWNTFSSAKKMKSESVSENLSSSRRDGLSCSLQSTVERAISCSTWDADLCK